MDRLVLRVRNMIAHGASWLDAIIWVTRKLPHSLQVYYCREIARRLT